MTAKQAKISEKAMFLLFPIITLSLFIGAIVLMQIMPQLLQTLSNLLGVGR